MEFFNPDLELQSVYVVDDCHAEPFLFVDHSTGVEEVAIHNGLSISVLNKDRSISFSLEGEAMLEFGLFDIKGSQVASIAKQEYSSGQHILDIGVQIPPGIYVLTTTIRNQPVAMKVLFQ